MGSIFVKIIVGICDALWEKGDNRKERIVTGIEPTNINELETWVWNDSKMCKNEACKRHIKVGWGKSID